MAIRFRIMARDRATLAGTGVVATERGELRTPSFMHVGTGAAVPTRPREPPPPVPAARPRADPPSRRGAPVHGVGPPGRNRQRGVPGVLAEFAPDGVRRGGDVPLPHRRVEACPLSPTRGGAPDGLLPLPPPGEPPRGRAAALPHRGGRRAECSGSSRGGWSRTCAGAASRRSAPSRFPDTPSAGGGGGGGAGGA